MRLSIVHPLAVTLTAVALTLTASACSMFSNSKVTFYGYPDNDPPGPAIAYNCGRGLTAGGTGTFADPLTMASAAGEYDQCEIVYLPYLEKYLRYEDFCQECTDDWNSEVRHIDVWTGSSSSNGGQTQLNCENTLTPDNNQGVIRQPSSTLTVNTAALFKNGNCNKGATFPNNNAGSFCGGGGGGGSPPAQCSWAGHCKGAPCKTFNDCSDALTCQNGHCA